MSKRTTDLLIEDIIDSDSKILDYTNSLSFEDSLKTVKLLMRLYATLK